jgi:hypothetical protein
MKKLLYAILLGTTLLLVAASPAFEPGTISAGQQPQIAVDNGGIVRVVFGQKDKIFCAASTNGGLKFSQPVLVAEVPKMHLGMSRGPQIASSANYSVITAQDELGNIHWYRLKNSSGEWKAMGIVNDLKGSAPEGLMGLAADKKDGFYAVWLDTRAGGGNNIYFSTLADQAIAWSKNRLVYRSPDKLVCGCCKPNIAVRGREVAIMFRNWLKGSRDLYLLKSVDGGASFIPAQKLGKDTWKLNGCPMDGGGVMVDQSNLIRTTWQREGIVYYAEPGKPEVYIGKGRNCAIAGNDANTVLTFQDNDIVKSVMLKNKNEIVLGKGGFLKAAELSGNKVIYVWEQDNQIKFKII